MWKTRAGSTGRLIQLCLGYFAFYVVYSVALKYYTAKPPVPPRMADADFAVWSTLGGTLLCLGVVLAARWFHLHSTGQVTLGSFRFSRELLYVIPSGVCTAVVIPTTTLMYTLPITVMVAMIIMRGSIIIVSRAVDGLQIWQGILKKRVYASENLAIVFAVLAVATQLFFATWFKRPGEKDLQFQWTAAASAILGSYVVAYTIRLYIMNYYKNTRPKGIAYDNKGFFGVEQISASSTLAVAAVAIYFWPTDLRQIVDFRRAVEVPSRYWLGSTLAGATFGIVAFFSVFLFMFQGRTATFAGLVNRLTSLIAGTAATLVFAFGFGGRMPATADWWSLGFIFVSVGLLSSAERRRVREATALAIADRYVAQFAGSEAEGRVLVARARLRRKSGDLPAARADLQSALALGAS